MPYIGKQSENNAVDISESTFKQGTDTSSGATVFGVTHESTDILRVHLNGIKMVEGVGNDYTITSTAVVFASAPADDDIVNVNVYEKSVFIVADTVRASTGGTFAGNVVHSGTVTNSSTSIHTGAATFNGDIKARTIKANDGTAAITIADSSGAVAIAGDLTVNGTNTVVNSTTLQIDDKNIELAHSPSGSEGADAAVDGGGIILRSSDSDKTITWTNSTDTWDFNQGIKVTSGNSEFSGNVSLGDNNITNVGDIALDTITADGSSIIVNTDTALAAGVDLETSTTGKVKQKGAFMQSSTHQALTLGY